LIGIVCLFFLDSFGQAKTSYKAESFESFATGDYTPFWMVNHNWGIVSLDNNNFYVRGSLFHEQTIDSDWSFDVGLDMLAATSSNYGDAWIQQLYGRLNWKFWRLDIGSREDYDSFLHPYLSSGDFVNSNNARPLPQLRISTSEFLLIPWTKGNMFLKGDFSIGKYMDSQWKEDRAFPANKYYTTDILSHKKSIYFRFGDIETKNKRQFIVGLSHAAQWGGILYKYIKRINSNWQYETTNQPHGLDDFFRMVVAREGSSSSSDSDGAYVSGSQWGAYTLRYDNKLKNENRLSVYLHHFFDDGSGMAFENYRDNLIGLEFRSKGKTMLSGAVFESIYTKQQTGPIHHNIQMDDEHKSLMHKGNGNDNYYNNTDYVQGPSYFGKTMGTPLFLSPEYNTDGNVNFKSSRIIAFHFGLEGYLHPELQYRLLLTTGQSWGRYSAPFTAVKKGTASQLELIYTPLQKEEWELKLSIGYDSGAFFGGDTFGGGFTLIKRGVIYPK
jgi:hypothetical protein